MILKHLLTILSARRNEKGKHYGLTSEHLAWAYFSRNTAQLTGTGVKGTHVYGEGSHCLRGFIQKCHSGFSVVLQRLYPLPTDSVLRALELKGLVT